MKQIIFQLKTLKNFVLTVVVLFGFVFTCQGQDDFSDYNRWSVFTNRVRPFTGIVDMNIHIPVRPKVALITGIHHYSFFYTYDRQNEPGLFNIYDEQGYLEWTRTNIISLDLRKYERLQTMRRSGNVVAIYTSILNRLAIADLRYTQDMVENPLYEEPFIMLFPDPFMEPEFIPASYDNLKTRSKATFRLGLEVGRRYWNWDHSHFKEFGFAIMAGSNLTLFPVVQFRIGL
jgi:hypothetical protein